MEGNTENRKNYPFEIDYGEKTDWSDLTIDVELSNPASDKSKKELETLFADWAERGIEKGYGDGVMHDWSEEENEWDMGNKRFRFWVDAGSSSPKEALNSLFLKLAKFKDIKRVKLESRYED